MKNKVLFMPACIAFLILSSCYAFSSVPDSITLEMIYRDQYFAEKEISSLRSMADGEHYTTLENQRVIVSYDYKTGTHREVILSLDQSGIQEADEITEYEFSIDENKILITTGVTAKYRYSFEASYYIYDRLLKKAEPLLKQGKQQLASFSPDGSKVAFVRQNNLFVKNLLTGEIKAITRDGYLNKVINGAPDWVYEEEFGFTEGFCWSPDSKKIGFYRFDESLVKEFDMVLYDDLYPRLYRYKYPKAGEVNSLVSIHIANLESDTVITAFTGTETDQYIPRIKWTKDPEKLCIIKLNRLQNQVDVLVANAADGTSKVVYSETNARFISSINDDYIEFLNDGKHFIIRREEDKFLHYYRYTTDGQFVNQITRGEWDVAELIGIDHVNNILYYTSGETSPIQRDVYSIKMDGSEKQKLSANEGTNRADFSRNFRYYINSHSSANQPLHITLHAISGKLLRVLEDNQQLKIRMKECGFSVKEFIEIPAYDNMKLNAYIIKPADFDPGKKYPVFMNVYGGPESQTVIDAWDKGLAWEQLLVQQGYIVVCVDNRGTDGRGEDFKKATYMQLGKLETEDQIKAAKYLASLPYVDGGRIGIWGWSYGGYMSLLCLMKGSGIFRAAIAVAPVTNWRFYDSVYTERFMRTPRENASGYDDNSPINHVAELEGKLLLIHGTADDNVHFQNTMELVEKLVQADKKFELMCYPDRNHGISGGNTRLHLYRKMTDFILTSL